MRQNHYYPKLPAADDPSDQFHGPPGASRERIQGLFTADLSLQKKAPGCSRGPALFAVAAVAYDASPVCLRRWNSARTSSIAAIALPMPLRITS